MGFGDFKKDGGIKDVFGASPNFELQYNRVQLQELCQYDFNGTSQYLNFGDILDSIFTAATPQFTIELWIKRDVIGVGQHFIGKWDNGQKGWKLSINTSNIFQWHQSVDGVAIQGYNSDNAYTNITDWQHIAFTLDYSQGSYSIAGKLYVDGLEQSITASTITKNTIVNNSSPLTLGAIYALSTPVGYFNGQMRGVVITNRVKDAAEILADFNLGNGAIPTSPDFYCDFRTDIFSGGNWIVEDLSGNSYDGASVNMLEANHTCSQVELFQNKVNTGFLNSVTYSVESDYSKRSSASEFKFNYTGTEFWIRCSVTGVADLVILEDGVHTQTLTMVDSEWTKITITGTLIQLIEAPAGETTLKGCRLKEVAIEPSKFTKINEGIVPEIFTFLGDSITSGVASTDPSIDGYGSLIRYTDNKTAPILGYGGALLKDFVDLLPTSLDTTMSWITDAFSNTLGRKVLTMMIGTNDWAAGFSASAINTRYNTLVDRINTDHPDIEIFVLRLTYRVGEDAVMTQIRADQLAMCTSKSWCTHIDTSTIGAGDLADTVHLTTAGHLKLYNIVKPIIL